MKNQTIPHTPCWLGINVWWVDLYWCNKNDIKSINKVLSEMFIKETKHYYLSWLRNNRPVIYFTRTTTSLSQCLLLVLTLCCPGWVYLNVYIRVTALSGAI